MSAGVCDPNGRAQRTAPRRRRGRESGQSLVEFALVLIPLLLVVMGIIQFGFIFNTYVTLSNGVREAARDGSIYVYSQGCNPTANDALRNERIRRTLLDSINLLRTGSPQFATSSASAADCPPPGGTWTSVSAPAGSTAYQNGDLLVTYGPAPGLTGDAATAAASSNARRGQALTVRATYHQDLIVPLIATLLPRDLNGRLGITAEVTMVVN